MRGIANFLWHFPFFGFMSAFFNFILGGILVLTVVGAPIGLGLIQYAKFLLAPYSNAMISKSQLEKHQKNVKEEHKALTVFNTVVSILWIPFGVVFAIMSAIQGIGLCVSVIGVPVGVVVLKSLRFYFNPVNQICVPRAVSEELEKREDKTVLDKYNLAS